MFVKKLKRKHFLNLLIHTHEYSTNVDARVLHMIHNLGSNCGTLTQSKYSLNHKNWLNYKKHISNIPFTFPFNWSMYKTLIETSVHFLPLKLHTCVYLGSHIKINAVQILYKQKVLLKKACRRTFWRGDKQWKCVLRTTRESMYNKFIKWYGRGMEVVPQYEERKMCDHHRLNYKQIQS